MGDYGNATLGGPLIALEMKVWIRVAVILAEINGI